MKRIEQPCRHPLTDRVMLLCLNGLSDEEHNAWIKCFAARKKEKQSAFARIKRKGFSALTERTGRLIGGLLNIWFGKGDDIMKLELTPEAVEKLGREWKDVIISGLKPEDIDRILSGLKPEKRLAGLRPEERLAGLRPEERLAGLRPEEIEACLKKLRAKKKKHR